MAFSYDFRRITSREALIEALGTDEATFEAIVTFVPPSAGPIATVSTGSIAIIDIPMFIRHDIPKKNRARGHRTVWEPTLPKSEYKALARRLGSFFRFCLPGYPHDCVYGYRSGRNIRENATAHAGHDLLLSLDIRDFFPSISRNSVLRLFEKLGVKPLVSDLLSRFVTIGDALPLGLPTSPTISNVIALPIDIELQALAADTGATYTRYADDISFSSDKGVPHVDQVRSILSANGFNVAEAKTRRSKRGQAHFVTGLSISDAAQPHVPRKRKRSLRQELYFARKFGLADHFHHHGINDERVIQQEVNRVDGLVKFVAYHEPAMATRLKIGWGEILRENGMKPSFAPRGQLRSPFYIFVDEAEFNKFGDKFLAVGMAVSQHGPQIVAESGEVLEAALADLWAAGNTDAIRKKGLHFAEATEDLRLAYVKRLASMRFEGYVAFGRYDDPADYEATYIRLLAAMISRRLMAAESQFAFIYCEENSKVTRNAVTTCIHRAFDDLKARDDRRPQAIGVDFVSKPHLGVSAPDFLLGVLGRYLQSKPASVGKPEPRDRLMFERLRDKFRLILDVSTGIEYSRRNPIEPWH